MSEVLALSISIIVLFSIAEDICDETVLFQIKSYNLKQSSLKKDFISLGFLFTDVGLMASCASWALATLDL